MRLLFLGPATSSLVMRLRDLGERVVARDDRLEAAPLDADFLVSFGYRFILPRDVLACFPDRAVNLHISYLPWNRGAHPNVWSAYEGTPAGVTVHHMDSGIDTGDIIARERVTFETGATLRSSYQELLRAVEALFLTVWPAIRAGIAPRERQEGSGSFHRVADLERLSHVLTDGWDTPLAAISRAGTHR